LTEEQDHPRDPRSLDEELLEAESLAIVSQLSDASRVERIQEELRDGFEALAHIGKAVSIFGSARALPDEPAYREARDIARRLGEDGYAIITGGGPGIMEAANRGAMEAGAPSIGLRIDLTHEGGANEWVDLQLDFHYFFTRKVMFVRYASAFVVCSGGFGTLDELFEAATLRQTEKIRHFPIVLYGSEFWSGLVDWLDGTVRRQGRIDEHDVSTLEVTDDPERVLAVVHAVEHRRPRDEGH